MPDDVGTRLMNWLIRDIWHDVEEDDLSTEMMMALVAERYREQYGITIDAGDVAAALAEQWGKTHDGSHGG